MNKLNKILLIILLILVIALSVMTYMYFDMRKTAKKNLDAYVEAATKLLEVNSKTNGHYIIDDIKSIENPEERAIAIQIHLENGDLTEDVAKDLY